MSGVPNIDFDAEYRFKDGVTPLSAETFNSRLFSIHTRLKAMEQITYTFDTIATELSNLGIARVNALILPLIDAANTELSEISAILLEAQTKLAEIQATNIEAENVLMGGGGTVESAISALDSALDGALASIAGISAQIAALPGVASEAEARAGTDNEKRMTPLRTAQAIESQAQVGISSLMKIGAV